MLSNHREQRHSGAGQRTEHRSAFKLRIITAVVRTEAFIPRHRVRVIHPGHENGARRLPPRPRRLPAPLAEFASYVPSNVHTTSRLSHHEDAVEVPAIRSDVLPHPLN